MTSKRSDSQPKVTPPAKVVRLVDAQCARKEAVSASHGIRPTREGPWDPCRFQEYEISPEFRQQIMSAKPPAADPSIFVDTVPPKRVAEILGQGVPAGLATTVAWDVVVPPMNAETVLDPAPRRMLPVRRRLVLALLLAGALVAMVLGFTVARSFGPNALVPNVRPLVSASMALPAAALPSVDRRPNVGPAPVTASPTEGNALSSSTPQPSIEPSVKRATKPSAPKTDGSRVKTRPASDSFPLQPDD